MSTLIDLTGQRFGRWNVLKRDSSTSSGNAKWKCICDCGTERVVIGGNLLNGISKSCGCLHNELTAKRFGLPEGVAAFNNLYSHYRKDASIRKLEFKLTKDEFRKLTSTNCHYCGEHPFQVFKCRFDSDRGTYIYNGIDRINNGKGYIFNNCVPCCKKCNMAKSTMSYDEFVEWISKVYHYTKDRHGQ